ncbi:MAG: hemolysin family protein [Planctomycetota bacterium]
MTALLLTLTAACLLASYFAACHNALKALSRRRLTDLLEERNQSHRADPFYNAVPSLLLATGIARACAALVIVLATHEIVSRLWELDPLPRYAAAFAGSLLLMSVFTVALPVYWARYRREKLLVRSLAILHLSRLLFLPITTPLKIFDPVLRRISGIDLDDDDDLAEHVLEAVEQHAEEHADDDEHTPLDETQKQMIEGVVELAETTVAEIMTPRTDIEAIALPNDDEPDITLPQVRAAALKAGHSRIPVYRDSIDHVAGVLYAKDLIPFLPPEDARFDLTQVVREAFVVPEAKPVQDLLAEFRASKIHLAIVLDEYGGTAGLVTIEDILEEIVGEIHDEYEPEPDDPTIDVAPDELSASMDARLHIDELNDALGLDLPEDEDFETVAGYVVSTLGHIPATGESFTTDDGVTFTVDEAEKTKVLRVSVAKNEQSTSSAAI